MSETPASGGLTARLLDRVEGRVSALRPSLPPTFAAEQARKAPLLEITEEVPAALPTAPPATTAVRAQSRAATASPPPAPRLMPPAAPADAPKGAPAFPAVVAAPLEAAPARARSELPAAQAAATPSDKPVGVDQPKLIQARPEPVRASRPDSLTAAVMQLLDPSTAGTGEPPAQPAAPRPEPPAWHDERQESLDGRAPADPAKAERPSGGVTIHIGEIVVAPEPRAPARHAGPRAAWQPPLSLSEYRASRARERR
jgi:hypothetical protein